MPHAILKSDRFPEEILRERFPVIFRVEDYFLKFRKAFFDPKTHTALVETVVLEKALRRNFYCMITTQRAGELIVRLDPVAKIERAPGIQMAVAYLAHLVTKWEPTAEIEKSNLKRFFSLFEQPDSERGAAYRRLLEIYRRNLKRIYFQRVGEAFVLSDWEFLLPCDWTRVFGNDFPVEVEVGPGKGRFLFREARQRRDVNFLGIEWARRYLRELEEKLGRDRPSNVRVAFADARVLFAEWIPENSLQAVHVYFPDPWWKKRHSGRKLLETKFVANVERSLREGGRFYFATDVEEYFEAVLELLKGFPNFRKIFEKTYAPGDPNNPDRSNFEAKMRQRGRPVFEAHWEKWTKDLEVVSLVR